MAEVLNEEILESLEKRVDDLRNQYEQYFMGARKRPPEQERTTVTFIIRRLANQNAPNTRLRFRFQQLTSKFNSYNQYWNRTLQQIESGTYFRDRFKQQMHAGAAEEGAPPPPPPEKKAPVSDSHIDEVYKDFVAARKQLNQAGGVSKEKLAENIKKQAAALQEKYKGKQIKFKVVVEEGKAKLKATVK
ncbi:MAG TPA: MXAN_5187 C-terminal domain-containing protein [bacterium]|nr:MXAN_5187 C-terminal domain-containing protein [bacterium]